MGPSEGRNAASKTAEEGSIPSGPATTHATHERAAGPKGRSRCRKPRIRVRVPSSPPMTDNQHPTTNNPPDQVLWPSSAVCKTAPLGFDSPPGLRARRRISEREQRFRTCAMSPSSSGKDLRLSTEVRGFESRWRRHSVRGLSRTEDLPSLVDPALSLRNSVADVRFVLRAPEENLPSSGSRRGPPKPVIGGSTPPRETDCHWNYARRRLGA